LPRYYLHIRSGDQTALDDEGTDLPDLQAARADALVAARELFAAGIKSARDPLPKSIVIADKAGKELGEVRLKDVLPASFWK
jgi:uncharacterized protein DUF6894